MLTGEPAVQAWRVQLQRLRIDIHHCVVLGAPSAARNAGRLPSHAVSTAAETVLQ